jgi:single-stranded-DNA-specific exonuclease
LERQNLTQQLLADAEAKLQTQLDNPILIAYGNEWPEGIVGLVAGKLTEKYYRPTIIGSINSGSMKASARSIDGFHISEALAQVSHLLEKFGGHELAAGFTLPTKHLIEFQQLLTKLAGEKLDVEQLVRKLKIDAVVLPEQCGFELVAELEILAPFGFGNAQPIIAVENLTVQNIRTFGSDNQHLQIRSQEMQHVEIIGFNQAQQYKDLAPGDSISVAGQLGTKEWRGRRSIQIRIKDINKA